MLKTVSIRIPQELHQEFKVKMAICNESMQSRVVELIAEDIEKFKKDIKREKLI